MDAPFLQQLQHRTTQLRDALGRLEEQRARIDALIATMAPLITQYDRTIAAERDLAELTRTILPNVSSQLRDESAVPDFLRAAPAQVDVARSSAGLARPEIGDTVYQADGAALVVEDISDPALLTVRRDGGTPMKIGRRAVTVEPPSPVATHPARR